MGPHACPESMPGRAASRRSSRKAGRNAMKQLNSSGNASGRLCDGAHAMIPCSRFDQSNYASDKGDVLEMFSGLLALISVDTGVAGRIWRAQHPAPPPEA